MQFQAFRLLAVALIVLIGATAAYACPPGTVFSAYKGKGKCMRYGEGNSPVATCYIKKGPCAQGWEAHKKNSDRKNEYCCPTSLPKYQPSCESQCEPLHKSVTPPDEAERVYQNCILLCVGADYFYCPAVNGNYVKKKIGQSCQ
ncbi:MAG: hypothetical protein U1E49_18950 [Hyphomicrobiaceae bacterium]